MMQIKHMWVRRGGSKHTHVTHLNIQSVFVVLKVLKEGIWLKVHVEQHWNCCLFN